MIEEPRGRSLFEKKYVGVEALCVVWSIGCGGGEGEVLCGF